MARCTCPSSWGDPDWRSRRPPKRRPPRVCRDYQSAVLRITVLVYIEPSLLGLVQKRPAPQPEDTEARSGDRVAGPGVSVARCNL